MGSYLSEPITHKETECCEGSHLYAATASMQGYRVDQEDAHLITRIRGGEGRYVADQRVKARAGSGPFGCVFLRQCVCLCLLCFCLPNVMFSPEEEVWVFGVFDGHGGKMVSNMSAPTVLRCFQRHPRVKKSRGGRGGGAPGSQRGHAATKMLVEGIVVTCVQYACCFACCCFCCRCRC